MCVGGGTCVGRCVCGRMRTFSLYFLFSSKMKDFENFLIIDFSTAKLR